MTSLREPVRAPTLLNSSSASFRERVLTVGLASIALAILLIGLITIPQVWRKPYIGFFFEGITGEVVEVSPDSPAARAGVRPGDILTHVDGIPVRKARSPYRDKAVGDVVRFSLIHNDQAYVAEVTLVPAPKHVWANYMTRIALGGAFWLLGITAFIHRRRDEVAQAFLFVCVFAAGAIWVLPLTLVQVDWARRVMYVLVLLTGASFLLFHSLFPRRISLKDGVRRIVLKGTYLVALFLSIVSAVIGPFRLEALSEALVGTGRLPGGVVRLYFIATVSSGLVLLLSAYRSGSGNTRRRVRLIVFGTLLGCLPLLLLFLSDILNYSVVPQDMAVLCLVLVPMAYTVSISRFDLMAVDYALYRVLFFLIVALSLLITYLGLIALAGYARPSSVQTPLTGAVISLIVAVSFSHIQRIVRIPLDRFFYGPGYNYLDVLAHSVRTLAERLDEEALVEILTEQIPAAMDVSQAGLWILNNEGQLEWLGGWLTPLDKDTKVSLEALSPHLQAGTTIRQALEAEPILELNGTVRWWVPLVLSDELQGLWVVGPRFNDESFSPIDEQLMGAAARQGAFVIKVIKLVERLRCQLTQSEADRHELQQAYRRLWDAREEERGHLARELHDGVIQALYGFDLQLQRARSNTADDLNEQLAALQSQIQGIYADTRHLCHGLRPADLQQTGLVGAFRQLVRNMATSSQVQVAVEVNPPNIRFREDLEVALYRITQEALSNVMKHADAQHVEIRLDVIDSGVALFIQDDGVGFVEAEVVGKRLGLVGMHERVAALGGKLTIETAPGCGTAVWVHVPQQRGQDAAA